MKGAMSRKKTFKVGIVTVSDSSFFEKRPDRTGEELEKFLLGTPFSQVVRRLVPDEREEISKILRELSSRVDLVLTTGGTGIGPRDVTPEATRDVFEKELPGMGEAMRMKSLEKTPHALLSRAAAGVRGDCVIVNLPGSPKGALECLEVVLPSLPHAIDLVQGRVGECDPSSRD